MGEYVLIKGGEIESIGKSEQEALSTSEDLADAVLIRVGEISSGKLPYRLRTR
jgi:hypothetical protein